MTFKLTEEQINYLIDEYSASKITIKNTESILNMTNIVIDEEDYFELCESIISKFYSVKLNISFKETVEEKLKNYISLENIVINELKRKYINYIHYNKAIDELLEEKDEDINKKRHI